VVWIRCFSATLLILIGLVGCGRSGAQVTVLNHAGVAIGNIILSGSGWSASIARIEPSSAQTLTVHPRGESGLTIAFQSEGRSFSYPEKGYFEGTGDYHVTVTIETDLTATVESRLEWLR